VRVTRFRVAREALRIEAAQLDTRGIRLLDPLGYVEFMSLVQSATGLLTDSGGVQEETSYLGVPCFTLRDNTERPITVTSGTNVLLGLDPARISTIPALLAMRDRSEPAAIPGWDGAAAERLVDVLAGGPLPSRTELTARLQSPVRVNERSRWSA